MIWRKLGLLTLLLSTVSVSCAFAQREFEITPFGGSRFGGQIDESTAINPTVSYDYVGIKSSVDYGLMGDVTIFPKLQAEFSFARQPTSLNGVCLACGPTTTYITNSDLDMIQFGAQYAFRSVDSKFQPYVAGSLGFTHFTNSQFLGWGGRFSWTLGGGVKYFFADHFGVRFDMRWSPTLTTTGVDEYCDPFYGCYQSTASNRAEQWEANVGLILRFHYTGSNH
jgi:opacity protein-like surface antigen